MICKLRWCAGKFIYCRGAEHPMHFMPLQDFTLNDFKEQSSLFGLRAIRKGLTGNTGLGESSDRVTQGEVFAYLARTLHGLQSALGGLHKPVLGVVEYAPNVGPVFEYFKLLTEMGQAPSSLARTSPLTWTGFGPEAFCLKFEILHAADGHSVAYVNDTGAEVADWIRLCRSADVAVFNQYQAVREKEPVAMEIKACMLSCDIPVVFAAYAVEGDTSAWRTTIKGKDVHLPARGELETALQARDASWRFSFKPGYDEGFFLPEAGPPPGLLLGCAGRFVPQNIVE